MAHAPKVVVCSGDPVNLAGLCAVLDAAGVGPTVGCAALADLAGVAIRERVDVLLIDDNCGAIDPMLLREVMICARVSKRRSSWWSPALKPARTRSVPHAPMSRRLRTAHTIRGFWP